MGEKVREKREGEKIDATLIGACLRMFLESGASNQSNELYDNEFEKHFIDARCSFYGNEAEKYITQNSTIPEYLQNAENNLEEEHKRAETYIPKPESRGTLGKTVGYEVIGRYMTILGHVCSLSGLSAWQMRPVASLPDKGLEPRYAY